MLNSNFKTGSRHNTSSIAFNNNYSEILYQKKVLSKNVNKFLKLNASMSLQIVKVFTRRGSAALGNLSSRKGGPIEKKFYNSETLFLVKNLDVRIKMKKIKIFTFATFCSIALLLAVTLMASAEPSRTYFTGIEYDCFVDLGAEPWIKGNVMHMRDVVHANVDVSETPEVNGINTTFADAEFNQKTGGAVIRGTMSLQPSGIAGTWEGTWVFTGNKGIGVAQAVAHGTGALSGKTLFMKLYDAEPDDPRNENLAAMCEGIGGPEAIVLIEGYILNSETP